MFILRVKRVKLSYNSTTDSADQLISDLRFFLKGKCRLSLLPLAPSLPSLRLSRLTRPQSTPISTAITRNLCACDVIIKMVHFLTEISKSTKT